MNPQTNIHFWRAEQLAKDLELFSQHAGRKSVNMDDVILSTHRNEYLTASLRSFRDNLKAKKPQSDGKRKKRPTKEDRAAGTGSIMQHLIFA
nr:protein MHF1 homolog [Ipomoea batatas]